MTLNLSYNQIVKLPKTIINLEELVDLNLDENEDLELTKTQMKFVKQFE